MARKMAEVIEEKVYLFFLNLNNKKRKRGEVNHMAIPHGFALRYGKFRKNAFVFSRSGSGGLIKKAYKFPGI